MVDPGFWSWPSQLRIASTVASRYNPNFAVARQCGDGCEAIAPRQLQAAYRAPVARGQIGAALARMWRRIRVEPAAPEPVGAARRREHGSIHRRVRLHERIEEHRVRVALHLRHFPAHAGHGLLIHRAGL
ncbi:hypothetical protein NB691_000501 [Xanthomonas sacchari]|nr:hypothetical protein [Xanthomonas sacchari]